LCSFECICGLIKTIEQLNINLSNLPTQNAIKSLDTIKNPFLEYEFFVFYLQEKNVHQLNKYY
ncbi:MAG: hypothetical protein PWP68_349, partial [Rikenellaceae bacterium]|nr:hypothetical protein [Rikenellaceae bacterium]